MTLGQRRAGRIKRKLKADPDELWSHYPDKPKWMRWATYERHMKKFQAAVDLADYGFVASAVRRFPGMFPELEEAST